MTEVTWTPERIRILDRLFSEGLPMAEIGRRMGLTKNTIIGRLYRDGMCCPRDVQPPWDHFDMLLYLMKQAIDREAAIPRIKPPKKGSSAGRGGARWSVDFGLRVLGRGQNGSRMLAGSGGDF